MITDQTQPPGIGKTRNNSDCRCGQRIQASHEFVHVTQSKTLSRVCNCVVHIDTQCTPTNGRGQSLHFELSTAMLLKHMEARRIVKTPFESIRNAQMKNQFQETAVKS